MVDYTKSTGSSGTMRLRDTGSTIEFWLKSGYGSTFFGSATFTYSSPHGSGSFNHGYDSGDTWQKMGEINVSNSGTVSWRMPGTGTSSLGGPTTQSVSISRAGRPTAPSGLSEENVSYTLLRLNWANSGDLNGGSFKNYQVQVSSTPQSGSDNFSSGISQNASGRTTVVDDLSPGVTYYWHVRILTSEGYSPWSGIATFQMLWGAWVRSGGTWQKAIPYVRSGGTWKKAIPYIKQSGKWVVPDYA